MNPKNSQEVPLDDVAGETQPVGIDQTAEQSIYERRLERLADHRRESQTDSNALRAAVRAMNLDLLELELKVSEPLLLVLGEAPRTIDTVEELRPAIQMTIRLGRQAAQVTQLVIQLEKGDSERAAAALEGDQRRNCELHPNATEETSAPPAH